MTGMPAWVWSGDTRTGTVRLCRNATRRVRLVRRRCCWNKCRGILIACIRTSWRSRLPAAGCDPALRTGTGFRGRRIRPHRAAPARAKPRRSGGVVPRRWGHNRPVQGTKGNYRVNLRHGVSRLPAGMPHNLSRREVSAQKAPTPMARSMSCLRRSAFGQKRTLANVRFAPISVIDFVFDPAVSGH
jgi:hypothetical protein